MIIKLESCITADQISYIKQTILGKNKKPIPQRCNKLYLAKHGILHILNLAFDDSFSIKEKLFCILNDIDKRPVCKTCGNILNFNNFAVAYPNFCSRHCANIDPDVLIKNKTNVSISLKKSYVKNGIEIKKKRAETLYKNYGEIVSSPFAIKSIQDKSSNTILERYGVDNIFKLSQFRGDSIEKGQIIIDKYNKKNGYDIQYLGKNKIKIKNLCSIHGDVEMTCTNFYNRTYRNRRGVVCPICCPISSFSSLEIMFESILKDSNIVDYEMNTKNIIAPLELDFYLLDYNLAFELNGIYWHSEVHKVKEYHKMKTELCNIKNIRLIHLWEDDFYNNLDGIKQFVKSLFSIKITPCNYAISEISQIRYESIIKYSLIKSVNADIRYVMKIDDEVIATVGFYQHLEDANIYSIENFLITPDYNNQEVINMFINKFIDDYNPTELRLDLSRDYYDKSFCNGTNLKYIAMTDPIEHYLINNSRKLSYSCDVMNDTNMIRLYNAGNIKFVMNLINIK